LIFLSTCVMAQVSNNSVSSEHITFLGISMNDSIDSFENKLAQKDVRLLSKKNIGERKYEGSFAGYKSQFLVFYDERNKMVYKATVLVPRETEAEMDNIFQEFKSLLSKKYAGEGKRDMYDEALKPMYYIFITDMKGKEKGQVQLSTKKYEQYNVVLDYYDSANYFKHEESRMDDL